MPIIHYDADESARNIVDILLSPDVYKEHGYPSASLDSQFYDETSWHSIAKKRAKHGYNGPQPQKHPAPQAPATSPIPPTPQALASRPRTRFLRKRFGLPITFEGQRGDETIIACADTGADSNVISHATVETLALPISIAQDSIKEFRLANGKIIKSIGTVSSRCVLAPGRPSMVAGLACIFYVFETLAVPLILGMPLLEETETLSKFRDRLVEQIVPAGLALQVNHIGSPRRRLLCSLDGSLATANLDSGSDADFLSAEFARGHKCNVRENQETIMFADGSIESTCGVTYLPLALEAVQPMTLEFHVCANLAHDVIVGLDSIEDLEVFTHHSSSLISSEESSMVMSLEPIRLLEKLDIPGFSKLKAKLKEVTERPTNISPSVIADPPDTFVCKFAGCQAAPFQSQYLLNAHANVHSETRPHYCPVKGCPRSLGGKGFKRENEMIRHGLVHESPGYVCPFCPDREHKYPRPDNLQRHVRVHHTDKDENDPALREVFSQRPVGPLRERRRRGAP